jgi:hypothetical protein
MNDLDQKFDRLLRSAARAGEDVPGEMPFGFDTRMVALWHAKDEATSIGLTHLIRRVVLIAIGILVLTAAGTYRETNESRDTDEPFGNEYAIADSAIQTEFLQ